MAEVKTGENLGKITQIIGAVLDIKFSAGNLPEINDAIKIPLKQGGNLVVEVAQHLGDDTVRCIAMGSTDGLVRGMDAIATGAPITVPVGENTLGRIFNVLGEPIDNKPVWAMSRFTDRLRRLKSSLRRQNFWRRVLRLSICYVLIRKAVRSVCSVAPALVRQC